MPRNGFLPPKTEQAKHNHDVSNEQKVTRAVLDEAPLAFVQEHRTEP